MRRLFCLILMGLLTAQNLPTGRSQPPQVTKPFNITYDDLISSDGRYLIAPQDAVFEIKFPSLGKKPDAAILDIVQALGFTI